MAAIPASSLRVHAWLLQVIADPQATPPELSRKFSLQELKFYQDMHGDYPYEYDPTRKNTHASKDEQIRTANIPSKPLNASFCLTAHLKLAFGILYGLRQRRILVKVTGKLWKHLNKHAQRRYQEVASVQKDQHMEYIRQLRSPQPAPTFLEPALPVGHRASAPAVSLYPSERAVQPSTRMRRGSARVASSTHAQAHSHAHSTHAIDSGPSSSAGPTGLPRVHLHPPSQNHYEATSDIEYLSRHDAQFITPELAPISLTALPCPEAPSGAFHRFFPSPSPSNSSICSPHGSILTNYGSLPSTPSTASSMIYPSPYASSSPQHNWLSVPYATGYGRDGYYSSPSSVSSSPMSSQFSASLSAYSTPVSEHQSLPPRCAELPLVGSRPLGFGPFGLFGPLDFGHAANNAVYDGLALGDAWAPGPSGSLQLDLQGAPPGQGEATAALTGGDLAFSMQMYETPVVGFSTDASSLT